MLHLYSSAGGPDDLLVVGETVYVSLLNAGRIAAVPKSGAPSIVAFGLDHPEGLAPAPGGDLYVVEQGKNRIDRVSGDGHGRVTPLKTFPSRPGKLGIDSIHALDNGNLLVPDSPTGELYQYDPISGASSLLGRGLGRPVDAIPYRSGFAVADEQLGLVHVSSAGAITHLADVPVADDLEIDAAGDLLVTSLSRGAVYRYREGQADVIARGFGEPQGLGLMSDGSLLVVDSSAGAVMVLPAACLAG